MPEIPQIPRNNIPEIPRLGGSDDIILNIKSRAEREEESSKPRGLKELFDTVNGWVIDKSPISLQEKLLFFDLLRATLQAGISVPESIRMIAPQMQNEHLKRVRINF